MFKRKRKYRIDELIDRLPGPIATQDFGWLLRLDFGIQEDDFNRDRKLKVSDAGVIPDDRLKIYAFVFQVNEDDLPTLPKIKSK